MKKKDVFQNWLHTYFIKEGKKYIWPQICYDTNTFEPIHIVFEKNVYNTEFVEWPVTKIGGIDCTNIDFTSQPPLDEKGNIWDFHKWPSNALRCRLMSAPINIPTSFWDWRRETRPQGNLACDLDCLCVNKNAEYIGIEATEIYFVYEHNDTEKDVYEHFRRLFTLRKGKYPGFNIGQLQAQKSFVDKLNGKLNMLFHKIEQNNNSLQVYEDCILLLPIDNETISELQQLIKTKSLTYSLKQRIEFHTIKSAFKEMEL